MHRRLSLLALATAVLALARPATAQLAGNTCGRQAAAMDLFAGQYKVVSVAAADSTDPTVLQGFTSFYLPGRSGSGFSAKFSMPSLLGGLISPPAKATKSMGNVYCAIVGSGSFYWRSGHAFDLRWEPSGMVGPLCPSSLWGGDCTEHVGAEFRGRLLPATSGFPVAAWAPKNSSERRKAERDAEAFYANLNHKKAMAFYTVDMELWGAVQLKERRYRRALVGEVRWRSYHDARIGVPGVTVGGVEYRMSVVFEGAPLIDEESAKDPTICANRIFFSNLCVTPDGVAARIYKAREIERMVRRFCAGSTAATDRSTHPGCGQLPVRTLAEGTLMIESSDDSLRTVQLCAIAQQGRNCATINPVNLDSTLSPAQLDSAYYSGDSGAAIRVIDADLAQEGSGVRALPGGITVPLGSRWERFCRYRAAEDSVRQATRPVPPGTARPAPVNVTAAVQACIRQQAGR